MTLILDLSFIYNVIMSRHSYWNFLFKLQKNSNIMIQTWRFSLMFVDISIDHKFRCEGLLPIGSFRLFLFLSSLRKLYWQAEFFLDAILFCYVFQTFLRGKSCDREKKKVVYKQRRTVGIE